MGNGFEFTVKRAKMLKKPWTHTFDTVEEGLAFCSKMEAMLDAGILPPELTHDENAYVDLSDLIKGYLLNNVVAHSDHEQFRVMNVKIGKVLIKNVNYKWVESWISQMKVMDNLAPSTIRHYVGALGRCFDWAARINIVALALNPIRMLPKKYAQYSVKDTAGAEAFKPTHVRKEDNERDRRLEEHEEVRVRLIMNREKPEGHERAFELKYQSAIQLVFDLALETAMRMREIFTLTLDQIDLDRRTIFLDKTKNGHKRQVPLSSVAMAKYAEYREKVVAGSEDMLGFAFEGGRVFPWWNGKVTTRDLQKTTALLSGQFRRIFAAAGCEDFHFHDTRHEATSRIFERTKMSDFEIMKITGHSSTRMLKRYANLRGSDLASKMW